MRAPDAVHGCAERIDVGQHVTAIPLIDDVTGDGFLDLVVATMNGQVRANERDDDTLIT